MFIRSINGAFAPKSLSDNPTFAEMHASVMDMDLSLNNRSIKKSLRNDMAAFGSDFKKATAMAREKLNTK